MITMNNKKELLSSIVKITNPNRPVINIPSKFAKKIDTNNTHVKFSLSSENEIELELCEEDGKPIKQKQTIDPETILQKLVDINSTNLNIQSQINNEFNEIKKSLNNLKITPHKNLKNIQESNNESSEDIKNSPKRYKGKDLIPISDKTGINYKYIYRYQFLDYDLIDKVDEMINNDISSDRRKPKRYCGVNYIVSNDIGIREIILDSPYDGECSYKGQTRLTEAQYFNVRLLTFIKDENGIEQRVPYEEIKPFEKEAVFEFISYEGDKFQLNYEEVWFDKYDLSLSCVGIEELLSVELYEEYKAGKWKSNITPVY